MKSKGLGRGLSALLPENETNEGVSEISLSEIDPNPYQPRRNFDDEAIAELADSIRTSGLLQPILVTPRDGRYCIVAGERRFRASRLAGLDFVPCIVRELSEKQQMEAALVENLQRKDLNAIEEASGIRALMDRCGYTQETAAERLGRSRPAIANLLRLLTLSGTLQDMVRDGRLSAGHARVLAGIDDEARRISLAGRVLSEGLSVRQLEVLSAQADSNPPVRKTVNSIPPLELRDMEERLRSVLGVRATVSGSLGSGKVVLRYTSRDELDRIYAAMEKLEGQV